MAVESIKAIPIHQVRAWANQLAGEARDADWLRYSYVVPDVLNDVAQELEDGYRGLIGLVGRQGVGKSSALMALMKGIPFSVRPENAKILFKWRREKELFAALLNNTHEASEEFMFPYISTLMEELTSRSYTPPNATEDWMKFHRLQERVERRLEYREDRRDSSDLLWVEAEIGKAAVQRIRQDTWLGVLHGKEVILIDTPDYSKSDMRRMHADLEEIYWFWNNLMSAGAVSMIVVAIQKEMFRSHYFLDKMRKFELWPLTAEQMVEAYRLRFDSTYPFTEAALLTLARMSRGIFRRFLRYIVFALDFWQKPNCSEVIDEKTVRKAIPSERLAEDMELEFVGLFPQHSELRTLAVRLVMYLQENGPQKQSQLVREFDVEQFTMSRALSKLESSKHVTRRREGTDKIVSLSTC